MYWNSSHRQPSSILGVFRIKIKTGSAEAQGSPEETFRTFNPESSFSRIPYWSIVSQRQIGGPLRDGQPPDILENKPVAVPLFAFGAPSGWRHHPSTTSVDDADHNFRPVTRLARRRAFHFRLRGTRTAQSGGRAPSSTTRPGHWNWFTR